MSEPRPDPTFAELGVPMPLVEALAARGITRAFPIQAASLPDSLAGRDVLGRGRTGSGKTVAFALPLLQRVLEASGRRRPRHPRALVLVPTRELAVQVAETIEHLARAVRLTTMTVLGGVRYTGQVRKLERGVDVVIATPGRLEDLLAQGVLALDDVTTVVLDEADLMADMGFLPPVTRILEQVPPGQRMLFSATLDGEVSSLVDRFLDHPLVHDVDADQVTPEVTHHLFVVTMGSKRQVLRELVTDAGRTLLFARTKTFAERLAAELTESGIPAAELHGNLRQGARQRNLGAFAEGRVQVLVATDIAARGIHVDGVGLVVHVDPPVDPKAFLHRSGRTARAGAEGTVVTLATKQQNKGVRRMMATAHITPVQTDVEPGHELIAQVRAPRVAGRAQGSSIFEPDPEDVGYDDAPPPRRERGPHPVRETNRLRPGRVHREQRGDRPERDAAPRRPVRGDRPVRDAAPRRPARGEGPRWRDIPIPDARALRRADGWADFEAAQRDDPAPDRRGGQRDADRRPRRPVQGSSRAGRGSEHPRREDRPRREERPREERPRRDDRAARPAGRTKDRWSASDRARRERTASYLEETGLSGGRRPGRTAQAGTAKPGKVKAGKVKAGKVKPGKKVKAAGKGASRATRR